MGRSVPEIPEPLFSPSPALSVSTLKLNYPHSFESDIHIHNGVSIHNFKS